MQSPVIYTHENKFIRYLLRQLMKLSLPVLILVLLSQLSTSGEAITVYHKDLLEANWGLELTLVRYLLS